MLRLWAGLYVFVGGFVIMVLEIVGARYLAKDFGGSFYVWISQIGVILIALALGYLTGGWWADRLRRPAWLAAPLGLVAGLIYFIPSFTPPLVNAIIMRHPLGHPIPPLWQKLDPVLGSALIFWWPCFVLATLSPCMIRFASRRLAHVGAVSGWIYAASTLGSIVGVFVSGYLLLDYLAVTDIFRWMGGTTALLGLMSLGLDRCAPASNPERETQV